MNDQELYDLVVRCLKEDVGDGDHSSLACIPADALGKSRLLVKEEGVIAGVDVVEKVFKIIDDNISFERLIEDGSKVKYGDVAFYVSGLQHSLLKAERLVLNIMQRMSGIATATRTYVDKLDGLKTKVLDTRKTTPGIRFLEKEAVKIGGGTNHRFGLYDMIMLKDNHIDFAGGIEKAIKRTNKYLKDNKLNLKIEIEARNIDEVKQILSIGHIDHIMLDNFNVEETAKAVKLINGKYETESSGGITLDTIRDFAECGVDYVSVGALTHHIKSLDMSLKAIK
ncbi:MAG: carboxylating nicotinate-nucleotide diphosphorylase [Bacteroidales bacterium]|nr:carboxylating nicotinate-nucleotide diphosphorylase [Bacteroidales bacterium]